MNDHEIADALDRFAEILEEHAWISGAVCPFAGPPEFSRFARSAYNYCTIGLLPLLPFSVRCPQERQTLDPLYSGLRDALTQTIRRFSRTFGGRSSTQTYPASDESDEHLTATEPGGSQFYWDPPNQGCRPWVSREEVHEIRQLALTFRNTSRPKLKKQQTIVVNDAEFQVPAWCPDDVVELARRVTERRIKNAFFRDQLWYGWKHLEHLENAAIRDRWNAATTDDRTAWTPQNQRPLGGPMTDPMGDPVLEQASHHAGTKPGRTRTASHSESLTTQKATARGLNTHEAPVLRRRQRSGCYAPGPRGRYRPSRCGS